MLSCNIGDYLIKRQSERYIIKVNIDELIYEATVTIRGKKHRIPNEFSICNYFNVNTDKDKGFIEYNQIPTRK